MTKQEVEETNITRDGILFTPIKSCEEKIEIINGEEVKVFDYTITTTTEEVYQKYLADKANPPKPEPTEVEKLNSKIAYIAMMEGYDELL